MPWKEKYNLDGHQDDDDDGDDDDDNDDGDDDKEPGQWVGEPGRRQRLQLQLGLDRSGFVPDHHHHHHHHHDYDEDDYEDENHDTLMWYTLPIKSSLERVSLSQT